MQCNIYSILQQRELHNKSVHDTITKYSRVLPDSLLKKPFQSSQKKYQVIDAVVSKNWIIQCVSSCNQDKSVCAVTFSQHGNLVLFKGEKRAFFAENLHKNSIDSLQWSLDGRELFAASSEDQSITKLDIEKTKIKSVLPWNSLHDTNELSPLVPISIKFNPSNISSPVVYLGIWDLGILVWDSKSSNIQHCNKLPLTQQKIGSKLRDFVILNDHDTLLSWECCDTIKTKHFTGLLEWIDLRKPQEAIQSWSIPKGYIDKITIHPKYLSDIMLRMEMERHHDSETRILYCKNWWNSICYLDTVIETVNEKTDSNSVKDLFKYEELGISEFRAFSSDMDVKNWNYSYSGDEILLPVSLESSSHVLVWDVRANYFNSFRFGDFFFDVADFLDDRNSTIIIGSQSDPFCAIITMGQVENSLQEEEIDNINENTILREFPEELDACGFEVEPDDWEINQLQLARGECSYDKGYVEQNIFICIDCCVEHNIMSGMCEECSLHCHEGHQVKNIGKKKNFRCDCGNGKFATASLHCQLQPEKSILNEQNHYNHNFMDLWCYCNQQDTDEVMIQCSQCQDWFHLYRNACVGVSWREALDELSLEYLVHICEQCKTSKFNNLQGYLLKDIPTNGEGSHEIEAEFVGWKARKGVFLKQEAMDYIRNNQLFPSANTSTTREVTVLIPRRRNAQ